MNDLEKLIPNESTIQTKDAGPIVVRPFKVKQLRAVLAALEGIEFDILGSAEEITKLMSGPNADKMLGAVALCVGHDIEWIENELYPGELLELVLMLIEVNASFFVQTGLKKALESKARIMESLSGAKLDGASLPPASSDSDTNSPTS